MVEGTRSPKRYGTAVALCGIFGVLGVHHFYLGNWLHGLLDVGLLVLAVSFYPEPVWVVFLIVDAVHTMYVFYKLIVGEQRDAQGLIVTWHR